MIRTISAIIIGLAIIIACIIVARSYTYKFKTKDIISVAGSAQYDFTADLIVWSAGYERTSMDIKDAYSMLKNDAQNIQTYLTTHGINSNEIIFSSVVIDKQYETQYNNDGHPTGTIFKGYKLRQSVKIESRRIDNVEKVSREITELLQSGIELSSDEPMYYYTKLSDLKIDLLAKAAADAYTRSKTIADNAHGKLGRLRQADMGVFQITGRYSNESYTYSGALNTSSKSKTANVVVHVEYELE